MTPRQLPSDPFTGLVGLNGFTVQDDGSVTARFEVTDEHLNLGGIVHGGALATLLDGVMGVSVTLGLAEDEWCATETLTLQFLRPASGALLGRGWVTRRGRSTAFVDGEVHDGEGRLVARATGVWAIRTG